MASNAFVLYVILLLFGALVATAFYFGNPFAIQVIVPIYFVGLALYVLFYGKIEGLERRKVKGRKRKVNKLK